MGGNEGGGGGENYVKGLMMDVLDVGGPETEGGRFVDCVMPHTSFPV